MIPGSRLAAFFARVLRAESFTLVVAPAIADLQFERPTASRMKQARNYVAAWQAFGGALFLDLAALTQDMRRIRGQALLSSLWPPLLLALYTACSLAFIADISTGAEKLSRSALIHNAALRSVATVALVLVCTSGCFFVLGLLSNICTVRRECENSVIRSLLEEQCPHSSRR